MSVYQDFPAAIPLHNTAATYSPANQILILNSLNDNIRQLGEFVVQLVVSGRDIVFDK